VITATTPVVGPSRALAIVIRSERLDLTVVVLVASSSLMSTTRGVLDPADGRRAPPSV